MSQENVEIVLAANAVFERDFFGGFKTTPDGTRSRHICTRTWNMSP